MIIRTYKPEEQFAAITQYGVFYRHRNDVLKDNGLHEGQVYQFRDTQPTPSIFNRRVDSHSIRLFYQKEYNEHYERLMDEMYKWGDLSPAKRRNLLKPAIVHCMPFKYLDDLLEEDPEKDIWTLSIEMLIKTRYDYSLIDMARIIKWYFEFFPEGYFVTGRENGIPTREMYVVKPEL